MQCNETGCMRLTRGNKNEMHKNVPLQPPLLFRHLLCSSSLKDERTSKGAEERQNELRNKISRSITWCNASALLLLSVCLPSFCLMHSLFSLFSQEMWCKKGKEEGGRERKGKNKLRSREKEQRDCEMCTTCHVCVYASVSSSSLFRPSYCSGFKTNVRKHDCNKSISRTTAASCLQLIRYHRMHAVTCECICSHFGWFRFRIFLLLSVLRIGFCFFQTNWKRKSKEELHNYNDEIAFVSFRSIHSLSLQIGCLFSFHRITWLCLRVKEQEQKALFQHPDRSHQNRGMLQKTNASVSKEKEEKLNVIESKEFRGWKKEESQKWD